MCVPELEAAPLRISVAAPAFLVSGQSQNVSPSDRLPAPADRLRHGLPHGDHDRREDEILRVADDVLSGCRARLRIAELDKDVRRRADQVVVLASAHEVVDALARAFWNRLHRNALAAGGL